MFTVSPSSSFHRYGPRVSSGRDRCACDRHSVVYVRCGHLVSLWHPIALLTPFSDDWAHDWNTPSFLNADRPSDVLTAKQLLHFTKRIGNGLRDVAGVKPGEVVLLSAPNSILVPAALLGIICAGAIFSGANPAYTPDGEFVEVNINEGISHVWQSLATK